MARHKKRAPKCVLQGMDNSLLGDGVAVQLEEDHIEIENENGIPKLAMGTMVKVVVYGLDGDVRVWAGRVYYSTMERLQVDNIVICSGSEKRKMYRVNVNSPAVLLVFSRRPSAEHGIGEKLFEEPVLVRDISSGGCLLEVSKHVMIADKALKLRLTLYGSVEDVHIEIMNARDKSVSEALYGASFTHLTPRVEQAIDMYLLKVQQDQIRRSRSRLWRD